MENQFILAISTSSGVARVAAAGQPVDGKERILFDFDITDYKSQSALLLPYIQQHMKSSGLTASLASAVAVDVGPGGFTSLRTACGVAQGLALAWNVPTIPMTSFESMLAAEETGKPVTVLIDARLNEVYSATLFRDEDGTQWVQAASLTPYSALREVEGPVSCDKNVYSLISNPSANIQPCEVSAVRLARLAWEEFIAGRLHRPFDCQPLYVRDKVAQTTSERLASKHGAL